MENKPLDTNELNSLSPLVLAYIGDAIYESYIREHLIRENLCRKINDLHRRAIKFVRAKAQSDIIHHIEDKLTEEEMRIFKRGRNQKKATGAKNADIVDYRMATGFEALIGFLYLKGDTERLEYIISISIEYIEETQAVK